MSKITATFRTNDLALAAHNGERVTVQGETPDGPGMQRIVFPDGKHEDAFDAELTEWRLEK
jgi:hypothetical protein